MSYFGADHRFLQASIIVKLLMMMMVNILIMRKIKEKVFVKKQAKLILL